MNPSTTPPETPQATPNVPAKPRGIRRGVYVVPSLFTMGNIILGFYAVVLAYRGNFFVAPICVIVAGLLDAMDGRLARLMHAESEFGKNFDSLADVLTFGAVPAYLAFLWGLETQGRVGWLVPLFFLLCTAVRLARFNVQTKTVDSRNFVGLPSPAAAAGVACLLLLDHRIADLHPWQEIKLVALGGVLIGAGILMVSTFRYPSFKKIDLRQRRSYRAAILIAAAILVGMADLTLTFQVVTLAFVLSGPVLWLWGKLARRGQAFAPPKASPEAAVADE